MGLLSYSLQLGDPARRRVAATLTAAVSDLAPAKGAGGLSTVELYLPAWTPGSYLLREFAKHLGEVTALDTATGAGMVVGKTAKNRFAVEVPAGVAEIRVEYSIYAHELSVRTNDLTEDHGFLTGAAVFIWPAGAAVDQEVVVDLQLPDAWLPHSSLASVPAGPGRFTLRAGGLHELIDSPILAGDHQVLEFEVLGKPHQFVLDGLDGIEAPESLVPDTIAIIEHAAAVFGGELPYEEYKFLCMFAAAGRGGLEHRSSSALLAPRTTFRPAKDYRDFLGLVAHEFFHVWNVKRMRPAELWDFDYERENHTELLWVAEGFTAYFDDHLCRRAGVLSPKGYLDLIAEGIANLQRTPGRWQQTLSQASYDAWIRLYRPDEDTRNATLSYYGNGALVALCLDLRIRAVTDGARSLDTAMATLYRNTYGADRGYTFADVVEALSQAAGEDLTELVNNLVHRPLDPDFDTFLAPFGLHLRERRRRDAASLGVQFRAESTELAAVFANAPADIGGLMPGDEILALDDLRVEFDTWSLVFDQTARVDHPLEILISRRGRILTVEVLPRSRPAEVSIVATRNATPDQLRLRRQWLFQDPPPSRP